MIEEPSVSSDPQMEHTCEVPPACPLSDCIADYDEEYENVTSTDTETASQEQVTDENKPFEAGDSQSRLDSVCNFENKYPQTTASAAIRLYLHRTKTSLSNARILLEVLRPLHPDLPKDPRTLLKTPRKTEVKSLDGGCYVHLGLIEGLKILLDERCETVDEVHIQINIDGLQLYSSSNVQLWPILCRIVRPWISNPFVVGTYCGLSKPSDVFSYFTSLLNELIPIVNEGYKLDDKVSVFLQLIICDTPARSFAKQIKGHSGFHCCDICDQKGVYLEHRLTLPRLHAPKRTDESFRNRAREEHHVGKSPFELLHIDMIRSFCLDPMHALYLGIAKKYCHSLDQPLILVVFGCPVKPGK